MATASPSTNPGDRLELVSPKQSCFTVDSKRLVALTIMIDQVLMSPLHESIIAARKAINMTIRFWRMPEVAGQGAVRFRLFFPDQPNA